MSKTLEQAIKDFCSVENPAESVAKASKTLLTALQAHNKSAKENSEKQLSSNVYKCLKHAQQRLGDGVSDNALTASLCIALLKALETNDENLGSQLQVTRYNIVRKLVSSKLYKPAFEQAVVILDYLKPLILAKKSAKASKPSTDDINLFVGATLTLAVCWAEATEELSVYLGRVLDASTRLQDCLLRHVDETEAAKHTDSLFKYLYRGAVKLCQTQQWDQATAVSSTMVVISHPPTPALEAVAKLAPHIPPPHSLVYLTTCLTASVDALTTILDALKVGTILQEQLAAVNAALSLGTLLRKVAAPLVASNAENPAGLVNACGGIEQAIEIAQALELAVSCMSVGCRVATTDDDDAGGFEKHAHSAVVAAATALRIQSACIRAGHKNVDIASDCMLWMLGWSLSSWEPHDDDTTSATNSIISAQDLAWLASAVYNVGVQLHDGEYYEAASRVFTQALTATLSLVQLEIKQGVVPSCVSRLDEVSRKSTALANAYIKAGQVDQGLTSLAMVVQFIQSLCGCNGSSQQQRQVMLAMVATFVRVRRQLLDNEDVAAGVVQRGRKKAPPAAVVYQHLYELVDSTSRVQYEALELEAWASLATEEDGDSSANGIARREANNVLNKLLSSYNSSKQPVECANVLLLAFELDLSVQQEGTSAEGEAILDLAEDVLSLNSKHTRNVDVQCVRARVRIHRTLSSARSVVRQKLKERKQCEDNQREWRRQHPDRAVDSTQSCPVKFSLSVDPDQWESVRVAAFSAVEACTDIVIDDTSGIGQDLIELMEEFTCLLGIQGLVDLESEMIHVLNNLDARTSIDSYCVLAHVALDVASPSWANTSVQSLEKQVLDAAKEPRGIHTSLKRVALWSAIAQHHIQQGALLPAVYAASEAQRLASSAASEASEGSMECWYKLAICRASCMLRLSKLFETTGLAEEAVMLLYEGHCMASILGSSPFAVLFASRLARVKSLQHDAGAARQDLELAQYALDIYKKSITSNLVDSNASAAILAECCQAGISRIDAHLCIDQGSMSSGGTACDAALESCQVARDMCERLGDAVLSTAVDVVHAECLLTRALQFKAADKAYQPVVNEALKLLLDDGTVSSGVVLDQISCRVGALLLKGKQASDNNAAPLKSPSIWGSNSSVSGQKQQSKAKTAVVKKRTTINTSQYDDGGCLWAAYQESTDLPHLHRSAAAQLARQCGTSGHLHLATVLLHCSLGATMRLQYRLVQYTREQQLQKTNITVDTPGGVPLTALGTSCLKPLDMVNRSSSGNIKYDPVLISDGLDQELISRLVACSDDDGDRHTILDELNSQAEETLQRWLEAMPSQAAVCGIVADTDRDSIILFRMTREACSPIVVEIPATPIDDDASFLAHPIRTLSLDDDGDTNKSSSSSTTTATGRRGGVGSALVEMQSILVDSAKSMREMATDTRDDQRAWWRARVELDDRVAALIKHLDSNWLGGWRCLLLGGDGVEELRDVYAMAAERAMEHYLGGCSSSVVEEVFRLSAAAHAQSVLSIVELQQIVTTAVGTAVNTSSVTAIINILTSIEPEQQKPLQTVAKNATATNRRVKFQADDTTAAADENGAVARDLCGAFGSLGLNTTDAVGPPPSTARVKKHKSRMATYATPAPKKPPLQPLTAPRQQDKRHLAIPCTPSAPTTTALKPIPVVGTKSASTSINSSSNQQPVVLVLGDQLQALPWESMPSIKHSAVYRVPSLPCAVSAAASGSTTASASAKNRQASVVDLRSTFYAINPSGDLSSTQATFQEWFSGMEGWDGVSGQAPTVTDLAKALRTREFFVYFGHGGGEQYIPAGKLRALPKCATSLLMGCSSGKLKELGCFEPTGVVLAYLLAGCPAVVANLWDVTDKDIDRFSQSVLNLWLDDDGDKSRSDVSQGVAAGRGACKLPHLIGAAPVCYGLPTSVTYRPTAAMR